MITFPNAKINIGLNIVEKRNDGYHNIESVFYPIALNDILEIIENKSYKTSENKANIDISGIEIKETSPTNNLCIKAFSLIDKDYNIPPVKIHLHKNIPIGAGLGGGSSDAAFTIKLLNDKFKLNLSSAQMQDYASKIGSDCAFFIENNHAFCFERGDKFDVVNLDLNKYYFVLANPKIHVSTAEAYAGVVPKTPIKSIKELINSPIENWKDTIMNNFEVSIFKKYPEIKKLKETFYNEGAIYSSMTGSGSSVFGIFENKVDLNKIPKEFIIFNNFSN